MGYSQHAKKVIPKKVPETEIRPRQGIGKGNPTDGTKQGLVRAEGEVEQTKIKA